jgi:hypothetical protein
LDQRGELGSVGPVQVGLRVVSPEYSDLMAQDKRLEVCGCGCAAEQQQPAEKPIEDQVEKAYRHVHDRAPPLENADRRR